MCVMVNMYVCNSCQVLDLGTQGMRDQGTMWSELSAEQAANWSQWIYWNFEPSTAEANSKYNSVCMCMCVCLCLCELIIEFAYN